MCWWKSIKGFKHFLPGEAEENENDFCTTQTALGLDLLDKWHSLFITSSYYRIGYQ
jgi:hypothetical protein